MSCAKMFSRLRLTAAVAALSLVGAVAATPIDLSRVPLIVNTAVAPNLLVTFDDSGSMAFGYTPDAIEWSWPDTSGNNRANYCFFRHPNYYSASFNTQYFDPGFDYPPPLYQDGTPFPNASFTAAWRNGYNVGAGTVNLGTQYFVTYWDGMGSNRDNITHNNLTVAAATPMGDHAPCDNQTQNNVRNIQGKSARFPNGAAAFYYEYSGALSDPLAQKMDVTRYTAVNVTTESAAIRQAFANWFSYYRMRGHMAKVSVSRSFALIDPTTRVAWQNLSANPIVAGTTISPLQGTHRNNFFNWLFASPYTGSTPLRASTLRAGEFFTRSGSTTTNPYWDAGLGRELSCRQNFHVMVTDGYWNEGNPGGTPASQAINADTRAWTLPDGAGYAVGNAHSRVYWNELANTTGTCPSDNSTNCLPTLADIGFQYWARDLRTDLDNNVPIFAGDLTTGVTGAAVPIPPNWRTVPEMYFNPANNPASWQHLVQFIVGFGVTGTLDYDDNTGVPFTKAQRLDRLRRGLDQWPQAARTAPRAIDDAWHTAVNSRGQYLGAQNPRELSEAIRNLLESISNRSGQAGAAAASSTVLNTDNTMRFVAYYDTANWDGDVRGFRVLSNGQTAPTAEWSAQALLNSRAPNSRQLLTSNWMSGTNRGVSFRWASLSGAQQTLLRTDPASGVVESAARGQARLEYLRGERSEEQANGGDFRNRQHVLGPVIGSNTVYVAAPAGGYRRTPNFAEGSTYPAFVAANSSRPPAVYVGANDGFLHAFNAQTGDELWAYSPFETFRNLNRLMHQPYQFVPTVDGSPVAKDVFIGGQWRTVLLGSLRAGGQGIFALDVTNPNVTEGDAASVVMWEFSHRFPDGAGAARLGYTYGRPNFARLADGRWAAVFSGGYNSDDPVDRSTLGLVNPTPDPVVGDGFSSLFVVDLANGSLIREVILPASAHGLGEPIIGDYESDFVDDVAIAGDLNGNIWRIDLHNWAVDRLYQPPIAGQRPITARPRLFSDPLTQGFMVVVGTGKFIELNDRTGAIPRQAILGVRDLGRGSSRYPALLPQMVQQTFSSLSGGFFEMASPQAVNAAHAGWYLLLGNTGLDPRLAGERVIDPAAAFFQSGIALFQSFIPTDDPCQTRSQGAIYAFNAFDGAWTVPGGNAAASAGTATGAGAGGGQTVFDTDGDGSVSEADSASSVGKIDWMNPPSGPLSSALSRSGGGQACLESVCVPDPVWRRRGWRDPN